MMIPGASAYAQSENRPVKIFNGASGTIETPGGASDVAASATTADGGGAECGAAAAVSNINYNAEKIVYDMSATAFEPQSKVFSDFDMTRTIKYAVAEGKCAGAVSINFELSPVIHLPANLAVDGNKCKRLVHVERERAFGQITLAAYRQLGKDIEQLVAGALKTGSPAAAEMEAASGGLLKAFDAAQQTRRREHLASRNSALTYKDCASTGVGNERNLEADAATP
ncbi:MAG: hypothetical protein A3H92_02045 [Rhodospirillales bacterium RIFCSPLOWO2_02_FULL_58_16]|nr:MAG: hypothetical protein A3H92_02045 [Rhodospirillales bacterium RIFCSPLOWO2_02_FULL_58_16]